VKQGRISLMKYELWRYHYIVLFLISMILAFFVLSNKSIAALIGMAGAWSYFGALFVGFFYTHSLTSPIASATFFILSNGLNPFVAAALGGFGAMIGDYFIFKFVKTDLLPEARLLAGDLKLPKIKSLRLLHYLHMIAPILGGIIIASPLPDEIGAALLGTIEMKDRDFLIVSLACNTTGLLAIALLGMVF
jgi:hypothetical protein